MRTHALVSCYPRAWQLILSLARVLCATYLARTGLVESTARGSSKCVGQRNEVDQMMALLPQAGGKAAAMRVVRSQRKTFLGSTDASTMVGTSEAAGASAAGHQPATAAGDDESEDMGVGEGEEVLSKLGKDWPSKVLAARKWQDKKVLLDKLLSVTSGRRIATADYSEVRGRACVRLACHPTRTPSPPHAVLHVVHARPRLCLDMLEWGAGGKDAAGADGGFHGARGRCGDQSNRYRVPCASPVVSASSFAAVLPRRPPVTS